jgi:hypothetical protein
VAVAVVLVRLARDEAASAATRRSVARTAASRNVSPAKARGAWHIEIITAIATARMMRPFIQDAGAAARTAAAPG